MRSNNSIVDAFGVGVGLRTGERWEWRPLYPARHPIDAQVLRLSANGSTLLYYPGRDGKDCGELRFSTAPVLFIRGLTQLICQIAAKSPGEYGASITQNPGPSGNPQPLTTGNEPSPGGVGPGQRGNEPQQFQGGAVPYLHSPESNPNQGRPSLLRVLLVVRPKKDHYRLAQIDVNDLTTTEGFFVDLRSEYFRLVRPWRRYLSVWRFSHCDFYRVSIRSAIPFLLTNILH